MKILWITNIPIGAMAEHVTGKPSHGLWMDALRHDFETHNQHQLAIATVGNTKETLRIVKDNTTYYLLPGGTPLTYDCDVKSHIEDWHKVLTEYQPDIIQVWGSEFRHGLAALRSMPNIPAVVYIQGIVDTIYRYYLAGIDSATLDKSITLRDIIAHKTIRQEREKWRRQIPYERELFNRAGHLIGENTWCRNHCASIAPEAFYHVCPLSISEEFFNHKWDINTAEPHSIMCNAADYPLKGLQTLLYAIPLIRRKYPDIKLYVPGYSVRTAKDWKTRLKNTGYEKLVKSIIKELDIADNVVFTGRLSQDKMAELMTKARVFVMCSAIENHSSTLKEAMAVGVPCVASAVGGVPEYVTHGENGYLYRYEEYEMAAYHICQLLGDDELADKFSRRGREQMSALHSSADIYQTICDIYTRIIG